MDINALPILSYDKLCEMLQIDANLREWRSLFGLDDNVFNILVKPAFSRYVEAAQLAPASEAHHHCGPGGLVQHTYEVITLALRIRRGIQLPVGGSVAEINTKRHLWSYGVFAAAMLHDIGKLASSIRIQLNLKNGSVRLWNPHDAPMTEFTDAVNYQIVFVKTPYAYHQYVALSFFDMLPSMARSWLANETELMKQICAHLRSDRFESGTVGEIVEQADMQSTAKNLKEPMGQRFSDAIPLIDRFMGLIRGWIKDNQIRINVNGAMGWVDKNGYCYFVCRSLAEKLVADCHDKGITDIPTDPVRIYDTLQEHGYALATDEGKAIWTITVIGETFRHKFTCLKFEARRLAVPTRLLQPFHGTIEIESSEKQETAKQTNKGASNASDDAQKQKNQTVIPSGSQASEPTRTPEAETKQTPHAQQETKQTDPAGEAIAAETETKDPRTQKTSEAPRGETSPETGIVTSEHAEIAQEDKDNEEDVSLVFAAAQKSKRAQRLESEQNVTNSNATFDANDTIAPHGKDSATIKAEHDGFSETQETAMEPAHTPARPEPAQPTKKNEASPLRPNTASQAADTVISDDTDLTNIESLDTAVQDTVADTLKDTATKTREAAETAAKIETENKTQKPAATGDSVVTSLPGHYKGLSIRQSDIASIFFSWLRKGLIEKTLLINDSKAHVHIVKEGVFLLSPAVFKDFCLKHGMPETDHRNLSKKFDRLKVHIKSERGMNIHQYWVQSKRKANRVNGRVVPFHEIFGVDYPIPKANKFVNKQLLSNPPADDGDTSQAQVS